MESSQNYQIKLVDASTDEAKALFIAAPSYPLDFVYVCHIDNRTFEFTKKNMMESEIDFMVEEIGKIPQRISLQIKRDLEGVRVKA